MDIVQAIRAHNRGRDPERLALKYRAMRESSYAFLRGSCHLFYARLARRGPLKSAPLAWCCGDLHLANFGSYKGDNRLVYFDVNDFDEAALAPASWDLVRLLASVHVAGAEQGLRVASRHALCAALLDSYAGALAAGKAYWVERDTAHGAVGALLQGLRNRQRAAFLDARTRSKGRRRVLRTDHGKALPAGDAQRAMVVSFMADFARTQPDARFFDVIDVARRVAGTGSLGVERYVVLVRGKGSPDGNYLLDLKHALPSAMAAALGSVQPRWKSEAHRVVALQRRIQAVSMAFLQPAQLDDRPFVLRALLPSEDRVDFAHAAADSASLHGLMTTLGQVTAWAQLRSAARQGAALPDELVDYAMRGKWRAKLLDAAAAAAEQVQADAASYAAAYDAGAFRI